MHTRFYEVRKQCLAAYIFRFPDSTNIEKGNQQKWMQQGGVLSSGQDRQQSADLAAVPTAAYPQPQGLDTFLCAHYAQQYD